MESFLLHVDISESRMMHDIPLPPPWRKVENLYCNEVTGEKTDRHPFELFQQVKRGGLMVSAPDESEGGAPGRPYVGAEGEGVLVVQERESRKLKSWDFRCLWKELGLFGNVNSYGLTIRYFEDGQTVIKFDGLDGQWVFSQLLGNHGPIERYDLFVGAKVRVFGRHLTISSTSASTCQWIDEEGKRLLKRQDWLQSKIEAVGCVPVVRRNEPIGVKCNFTKKANSGNADLRRIFSENTKLMEQCATLGLGSAMQEKTC